MVTVPDLPDLQFGLATAVCALGVVMTWTTPRFGLARRAGVGSLALFLTGVMGVNALGRATYRIEVDPTGVRESSALGWRSTPWWTVHGAVDETTRYLSRRSPRSLPMLDHVRRRVYFTDDQGQEVFSIGDDLKPQQAKAILDHVLGRTSLQPEKRELLLFNYRS